MNDSDIAQDKPFQAEQKRKTLTKKWLVLLGAIFAIAAVGAAVWLMQKGDNEQAKQTEVTTYLTNNRDVVCTITEATTMQCENVQTGEINQLLVPEAYQGYGFQQSPDGARLLIEMPGGPVVTDMNFKNEKKVSEMYEFASNDNFSQVTWPDDSRYLLISEIKREQNDSEELPEPLIVSLLDLDAGESRRVYKTGEMVDVDSIRMLGSSGEYLFIVLPAAKNWVAQETNPPPDIVNAIRLSDGLVRQVSSQQINLSQISGSYGNGRFTSLLSTDRNVIGGTITIAQLEENEFGLILSKVFDKSLKEGQSAAEVFTSKGMVVESLSDGATTVNIVLDDGTEAPLKLQSDGYAQYFSFAQMPDLPNAP